jgi:uncharacterized membrane protein YdfJ with MMPL/SSD domain
VTGALARLEQARARRPLFGKPTIETTEAGTVGRVTAAIAGNPDGERAIAAVRELRSEAVPGACAGVDAEVYVGGDTAEELDYHDTVNFWLPLVLLFVLGLSFLLLTLAFRSIVVSATAIGASSDSILTRAARLLRHSAMPHGSVATTSAALKRSTVAKDSFEP